MLTIATTEFSFLPDPHVLAACYYYLLLIAHCLLLAAC